jgi:arylsulfatase A-like enzyme
MDVHSDYVSLPSYEREFLRPYDGLVDGTTQQLYRFALGELRLERADWQNLVDRYDAGIRQMDDRLGELFDYLERTGLAGETLVVFVSDHGEEFGEHGSVIHGHTQYEEVLRVPFIMRGPGIARGQRVPDPVSLVDVVPTVLGRLGLPTPPGIDGVDLLQPVDAPRALYAEADVTFPPEAPGLVPVGPHRAIRAGRFKLRLDLDTGRRVLHDLATDPLERQDVGERHPRVAALLDSRLAAFLSLEPGSAAVVPLSAAESALLRGAARLRAPAAAGELP